MPPPASMAGGAEPARECTGSFSSVSNYNTGEAVVLDEEEEFQLPFHGKAPFMGGPPEMRSGGDLQHIVAGASSADLPPHTKRKKKRCLPGTPDPSAEVVALSPTTLMATNQFVCEICHKGFQRDQNLQLHRRGHNLPWKLRQRGGGVPRKRVYVCPEATCVHHNPSRALGDLTGIKKHFCRKHGEKKWKCGRCAKRYAVHSDWKAHSKVCGTREYKCDCGIVFSRRDSFVTHRAFCDALTQENRKLGHSVAMSMAASPLQGGQAAHHHHYRMPPSLTDDVDMDAEADAAAAAAGFDTDAEIPHLTMFSDENAAAAGNTFVPGTGSMVSCMLSSLGARNTAAINGGAFCSLGLDRPSVSTMGFSPAGLSATALLQKASLMGATTTSGLRSTMCGFDNLPAVGHTGPTIAHGQHNGHGLFSGSTTPLVGFDADGLFHRQMYSEGAQSEGATSRPIRSPANGGNQVEARRREDKHVLDFMGVEAQRTFNGVGSFGHYLGPWA